jgi:hypothetical protein
MNKRKEKKGKNFSWRLETEEKKVIHFKFLLKTKNFVLVLTWEEQTKSFLFVGNSNYYLVGTTRV